jgi:hypothetical protein
MTCAIPSLPKYNDVARGASIDTAAAAIAARLGVGGPAALDVIDSGQRQTAVAATIGYSLHALSDADGERFFELGIFAEDASVPIGIAALLWKATAGLDAAEKESLCEQLEGLSLLTLAWLDDVRVLVLHDVIRDFALSNLSPDRWVNVHASLLAAARPVTGTGASFASVTGDGESGGTAWWRLPETGIYWYLWQYLTYHLQAALV